VGELEEVVVHGQVLWLHHVVEGVGLHRPHVVLLLVLQLGSLHTLPIPLGAFLIRSTATSRLHEGVRARQSGLLLESVVTHHEELIGHDQHIGSILVHVVML
jgi:hypothetical protein